MLLAGCLSNQGCNSCWSRRSTARSSGNETVSLSELCGCWEILKLSWRGQFIKMININGDWFYRVFLNSPLTLPLFTSPHLCGRICETDISFASVLGDCCLHCSVLIGTPWNEKNENEKEKKRKEKKRKKKKRKKEKAKKNVLTDCCRHCCVLIGTP